MKKISTVLAIGLLSSSIVSADPAIKLEGVFDFNTSTRSQNKLTGDDRNLSANNKSVVFNTSANITAQISDKNDDLEYGAKIVMITTTSPKKTPGFNGSHLYIQSDDFGKIEAGAPFDVSTMMQVNGNDVAFASRGGSWDGIVNTNPKDLYWNDPNAGDFYLAGFTSKSNGIVDREPSRKINYYTPKMNGFQFGITWIPDSTNGGADSKTASSAFNKREIQYIAADGTLKKYVIRLGATNTFAFGASYEAEIAEATSFKIAATGEIGKALQQAFIPADKKEDKNYEIDTTAVAADGKTLTGTSKLKNLKSYDIGANLTQGNFSYGVSYGNLCKSFTAEALDPNKNTDFYSASIAYKQGPIGVSLTYIGGSNKKTKFNSIGLGSEYKIASGLISYAEASYVSGKGTGKKFEAGTPAAGTTPAVAGRLVDENQKFNGAAFVLGVKVKI